MNLGHHEISMQCGDTYSKKIVPVLYHFMIRNAMFINILLCLIVQSYKKEGRQRGYAKHNFIRFEDLTFPNPYEYASFVLENLVSYSLQT